MNNSSEKQKTDFQYICLIIVGIAVIFAISFSWDVVVKSAEVTNIVVPLNRAAQASSVEIARKEIQEATKYIIATPRLQKLALDSDWQNWYKNLIVLLKNLQAINLKQASIEQKSLVLLQTNQVLIRKNKINIPFDYGRLIDFLRACLCIILAFIFLGFFDQKLAFKTLKSFKFYLIYFFGFGLYLIYFKDYL